MSDKLRYLSILILILQSGSLYWGKYRTELEIVLLVISIILIRNKKVAIRKENIFIFLFLSIMILISTITNIQHNPKINEIARIIIYLGINFILSISFTKDQFIKIYINEIVVISIISLISYFAVNFLGVMELPFTSYVSNNIQTYSVTPYYTIGATHPYTGIMETSTRNAGILWEPGAWQSLVNMAIIILLSNIKTIKHSGKYLIILIITVITTQSSTGYIILSILLFLYFKNYFKGFKQVIVTLLVGYLLIIITPINDVIYDKVIEKEQSYSTRMNDIEGTYDIFREKILVGYGYNSDTYAKKEIEKRITNNSNGLGLSFAMLGGIFTLTYLICQIKSLRNLTNPKLLEFISIIFCIIIIHSTEWFIFRGIFVFMLFTLKNKNEVKNMKYIKEN